MVFGVATMFLGWPGAVFLRSGIARYDLFVITVGVVMLALPVWLGVGSMLARHWARAWLWFFGWCGLLYMAVSCFHGSGYFPYMTSPLSVLAYMLKFMMWPFFWILFYGSRPVKAACEASSPKACMADEFPTPIFAGLFFLWFVAFVMLKTEAASFALVFAAGVLVCMHVTQRLFRLKFRRWWIAMVAGVGLVFWRMWWLDPQPSFVESGIILVLSWEIFWLSIRKYFKPQHVESK